MYDKEAKTISFIKVSCVKLLEFTMMRRIRMSRQLISVSNKRVKAATKPPVRRLKTRSSSWMRSSLLIKNWVPPTSSQPKGSAKTYSTVWNCSRSTVLLIKEVYQTHARREKQTVIRQKTKSRRFCSVSRLHQGLLW